MYTLENQCKYPPAGYRNNSMLENALRVNKKYLAAGFTRGSHLLQNLPTLFNPP